MATANTKQLEDKLAQYERIISDCSRCKTALASIEAQDAITREVPPHSASPLQQTAPKASSTARTRSAELPPGTTGQGQTPSSNQTASTSQPKPSSSSSGVVAPSTLTRGSSTRSGEIPSNPKKNAARRPSNHSSKQTTAKAVSSLPGGSSGLLTFTSSALDSRPTSFKPRTSGTDSTLGDASREHTAEGNLSTSRSNGQKARNNPQKRPEWVISADKMLGEIPLGWVWLARILAVDKSMLAAVATDTMPFPENTTGAVDDTLNKDHLLRLVRGFAHRHSDKRVNFQHFLLACLCEVLAAQKFPQSSIVEALQICISDTSERNIDRYLRGARWANELMNKLFFTGWRYRAIDLMVLWDRSIATYGRIASSSDSTMDHFVSHLTKSEYWDDVEEIPDRIHTTIPWIVKKELIGEVSYENICKALGYSYEYMLETKYLRSSTQRRPDPDIRSSSDGGTASGNHPIFETRQSADSAPIPPLNPTRHSFSDHDGSEYPRAWSQLGTQVPTKDTHDDPASTNPAPNRTPDPQRSGRMIPDRSAKPLGDITEMRQRRHLDEASNGDGEGASARQRTKRPLPDSPTSQLQSEVSTRRRQDEMERPRRRDDKGSPSRSGRDLHRRRDRA